MRSKEREFEQLLTNLLKTARRGKILREGIATAIIGRPNVGKSSLLNNLLREDKAIVTDIAGTTRDVIEEYVNINGVPLKLIDTAGIRETDDIVEQIGVERSKKALKEADLVLLVLNASEPLTAQIAQDEQDAERKSTIGTGDRSERIRTYNFPQNRVTDHRIGLTLQKLDTILSGKLDEVVDALVLYDQTQKLEELNK